jgi:hypothetical protein
MTNPKRGEIEIVLGKQKYQGKVTLDVVMRIEQTTGQGIVKLATSLSEGVLTTTQVVSVLTAVIRAGGNDVNEKQVGKDVWEAGLADGLKVMGQIIAQVLTAGGDIEGNEVEAEQLL